MLSKLWNCLEQIIHFFIYKVFRLKISEEMYENLLQFVKFGIVGVSNNLVHFLVYSVCIRLGVHYIVSNIIAFIISVGNAFYWNNKYVFEGSENRTWWQALLKTYISYAFTGILLSNLLLALWIEVVGLNAYVALAINLVITIPINFVINKFWAYRSRGEKDNE